MHKYLSQSCDLLLIGVVGLQPGAGIPAAANGDARRLEQRFRSRSQHQSRARLPFWQELGKRRVESRHRSGAGAESRPRSGSASHRAGARPGKSCRIGSVSIDRCERRRIAYFPGCKIIRRAARGLGSISYEVDLWGKNRNQLAAANHRADATQYDRDALQLIVVSDTATFYTQVLSLNERIRIAQNNLKNAEEVLRITEARFREGSISGLEVSQQRVAVNNIRAALTSLTEQRSTNLNALAILLGQAPQNIQRAANGFFFIENTGSQSDTACLSVDGPARH